MARRVQPAADYDSPWKDALDQFLEPALELLLPKLHAVIDWSHGYESLDKELQRISREGDLGDRLADKLFKVWRRDGTEAWLLIHVEVQGQRQAEFPRRMFVYHHRIFERYALFPVSVAILCDEHARWRPDRFEYNVEGTKGSLRFLIAKLLDYRGREAELERSPNPFAAVVLAHLKAVETRRSPLDRRVWKVRVAKGLYERGWGSERVQQLFRVIDWLMTLPDALAKSFEDEIYQFEKERQMPYLTSIERRALAEGEQKGRQEGEQKGRQEGRQEGVVAGLLVALELKFGTAGKRLASKLRGLDATALDAFAAGLTSAKTLDDVKRLLG